MMTYAWQCEGCGSLSAAVTLTAGQVPPKEAVDRPCEQCGHTTVQRVAGAADRRMKAREPS